MWVYVVALAHRRYDSLEGGIALDDDDWNRGREYMPFLLPMMRSMM